MSINSGTAGVFYKMLGLDPNKHLPTEGVLGGKHVGPERLTFDVWVDPKIPDGRLYMRVMVVCPKCGLKLSAGRWHQHNRWVHKEGR